MRITHNAVEWVEAGTVGYREAEAFMAARSAAIADGAADECVVLLQHPALYTAGTSARSADLLRPDHLPVFRTGRGGQYTYHGPGQRICYVLLDLSHRGRDVRAFVHELEGWLIDALAALGVEAERREGRVGVWVSRPGGEDKIAAIGVRVRRWVTSHGIALNVAPNLAHFAGIVPCGVADAGVTSLKALGVRADMAGADDALRRAFEIRFGPTVRREATGDLIGADTGAVLNATGR